MDKLSCAATLTPNTTNKVTYIHAHKSPPLTKVKVLLHQIVKFIKKEHNVTK